MTSPTMAGAVLVRDRRVLLGLRAQHLRSYPGVWDILGGHLEDGETPVEALQRELMEEAGVTPTSYSVLTDLLVDGETCRVFRVDDWWGGEPAPADTEHTELRWFEIAEACDLTNLALHEYRQMFRALVSPTSPNSFR